MYGRSVYDGGADIRLKARQGGPQSTEPGPEPLALATAFGRAKLPDLAGHRGSGPWLRPSSDPDEEFSLGNALDNWNKQGRIGSRLT